jgi:DNA polymerase alpha subunit p180 N terminal
MARKLDAGNPFYSIGWAGDGVDELLLYDDERNCVFHVGGSHHHHNTHTHTHYSIVQQEITFPLFLVEKNIVRAHINMSSSASRKVTKKAALERLRNARRKRDMGELDAEQDILDGDNFREEEDVYDVVDEEEYRSLVESRRQREDFVVDDGE